MRQAVQDATSVWLQLCFVAGGASRALLLVGACPAAVMDPADGVGGNNSIGRAIFALPMPSLTAPVGTFGNPANSSTS